MSLTVTVLLILIGSAAAVSVIVWLANRLRLAANPRYYHQKVIVITGASRGIGRSLALAFAARGANLALTARNVEQLDTVAGECRDRNPEIDVEKRGD